ncbi:MAG TPA: hypothetical protein VJP79_11960 [Nitrososphaera sp.]|nr:hypothetical protein [Nitrososphaera sp.]
MPSNSSKPDKDESRKDSKSDSDHENHERRTGLFGKFKHSSKQRQRRPNEPADRAWNINELADEMQKLGLEPTGLGRFITSLHRLAVASGIDPSSLASIIREIGTLSDGKQHPSIEQARKKIRELGAEQSSLSKSIADLQQRKDALEAEVASEENKKAADQKSLSFYVSLEQELLALGISLDDISRLSSMVVSARQLDYSHSALLDLLADFDLAKQKKEKAETEIEQVLGIKRATQQRLAVIEQELAEKQKLLDSAENLTRLGFGAGDLENLAAAIKMISNTRNIDLPAAKERLAADLLSYYANDQELRGRLRTLESLLREKEEKFSMLEADFHNEQAVLDNASKLIAAGLDEQWLAKLRNIIDSYGIDIDGLANELKTRNALSASIDQLAKTKKALEEEERLLRQKVVATEDQRIRTLSMINDLIVRTPRANPEEKKDNAAKIISASGQMPGVEERDFMSSTQKTIEAIRSRLPPDSPARLVLEHALLALRLEGKRDE